MFADEREWCREGRVEAQNEAEAERPENPVI
jgi:hypothetical protein